LASGPTLGSKPGAMLANRVTALRFISEEAEKMAEKQDEKQEGKRGLVVARKSDGKWSVKRQGARCALKTVKTREEAEAFARELASQEGVAVAIEEK